MGVLVLAAFTAPRLSTPLSTPPQGSGVIAVVVFGVYGSATSRWGMLSRDEASGVHEAVWDTLAFIANGLVFFWAGISAVNFLARWVACV